MPLLHVDLVSSVLLLALHLSELLAGNVSCGSIPGPFGDVASRTLPCMALAFACRTPAINHRLRQILGESYQMLIAAFHRFIADIDSGN